MTEKVLLVDDEEKFLETLAERMRARGMEVFTATSAAEAFELVEKESFDAIILDLLMPEVDGIQTLEALKKKNPDIQVILLTGHATVEKGVKAMKLGATDFLEKPASVEVLTDKIRKAHAKRLILVEKSTEKKIKEILQEKAW